ncbi:hypothetical protein ASD45_09820 [Pseudolabrys sp. Root1462]|jgi:hypothetical protein|uniref:hypothetical protein n=1 Tax=Pseudolabrys sp. Root1462 TaxID=1736466 RepID=UPI000702807D|nr:hypothetical protein [Pseudolabrys sp. Root1462]KQZ01126.1 hypothetical protein ASD45_09820 [Pseudolabrys sp. Root1462]
MRLNEESCPVPESLLGQLYRVTPQGLPALIDAVPANTRAMLAVYCYRRAHLASLGIAIAASCEEDDLAEHGGNLGSDLYEKSRKTPRIAESLPSQRKRISLSTGPIRQLPPLEDDLDN